MSFVLNFKVFMRFSFYTASVVGQKHMKRVSKKEKEVKLGDRPPNILKPGAGGEMDSTTSHEKTTNEPDSDEKRKEFTCVLCDLTVPTKASMVFHLNGSFSRDWTKKIKSIWVKRYSSFVLNVFT